MAIDLSFKSSVYPLTLFGIDFNVYEGIYALVLNLGIAALVTLALRAAGAGDRADETLPEDYEERGEVADAQPLPATPSGATPA
jgi:SSS family solute:Na+ symporter